MRPPYLFREPGQLSPYSDRADNPQGKGRIFILFVTESRLALGSIYTPIQYLPWVLSPGVKRPERETDHSPPTTAKVKKEWSYNSTSQYVLMVWCLMETRIYLHGIILR